MAGWEAAVGDLALRMRASRGCLGSGVPSRWEELSNDCMMDRRRRIILLAALELIEADELEGWRRWVVVEVVGWGAAVLCSSSAVCLVSWLVVVVVVESGASMAERRGRRLAVERTGDCAVELEGEKRPRELREVAEDEEDETRVLRVGGGEDEREEEESADRSALGGVAEAEMESRMRRRDILRLREPERAGRAAGLPVVVDEEVEKEDERIV